MKPLTQQILICITGCFVLVLGLSFGLSVAVNDGLAQFKQKAAEFLPATEPGSAPQNQ